MKYLRHNGRHSIILYSGHGAMRRGHVFFLSLDSGPNTRFVETIAPSHTGNTHLFRCHHLPYGVDHKINTTLDHNSRLYKKRLLYSGIYES